MILKCDNTGCANLFQDQKYGNGMRVHNALQGTKKSTPEFRCTVCTKVRGK